MNKIVKEGIVEVENAENPEQLKVSVIAVLRKIDIEIDYLWTEIAKLREGRK